VSSEQRRALRDHLPPELSALQRLLLLEIADGVPADRPGAHSMVTLEDLSRWGGATVDSVRDALKRMGRMGYECRVPIGAGKDGRPLYAVPGKRMNLRIPPALAEGRVNTRPMGESTPALPDHKGESPLAQGESTPAQGESPLAQGESTPAPYLWSPVSSLSAAADGSSGQQQPEQAPKKRAAKTPRAPKAHQVADDLTAAFWEHHGANLAQSFMAVRSVIRTAIGNGLDRDQLARALDQVARDGKPISGGTLQIALGRAKPAQPRPGSQHDVLTDPNTEVKVNL